MSEPLSDRALQRLLAMAADDDGAVFAPPVLPERYEILRELGRGGMGVVFEAFDRQLGRRCAVKTLPALAGGDHELRRRFAREALAVARLRHPHIATVYDATPDFISMQLIVGCAIDHVHHGERRLLVELVRDAARAVQHAHEQGVVHRDLKPSNLLVEGHHVFVVDFGLAKEIAGDASLSLAGSIVGTPAYMPPEQARGQHDAVDARSDVYGLGATLHHCLTGRPPFVADELPTLLRHVVEQDAKPTGVDRDLDLVVLKCLEKDPARRYQSAGELATDLDRWLTQQPVHARRPSFLYRLQKGLQRQRSLWRAAGVAAVLVALILVPIALRESAARSAANDAVELADHTATVLRDAATFFRLGENTTAGEVLDGGIARAAEFLRRHEVPRARYLLGRLLRARGRTDDALAALHAALAADPSLVDARFERGLLLAAKTDASEPELTTAIADLRAGVQERSVLTAVDLLFGRAELLRLEGRYDDAMELCKEVLEYDTAHVPARLAMGRLALARGETDLARYYTASALDFERGYGAAYVARERQHLPIEVRGLEFALIDYSERLRDHHDSALDLAYRGIVGLRRAVRLSGEGRDGEALAAALSAIADHDQTVLIDDGLPGALNNRAVCRLVAEQLLLRTGDTAGAVVQRTAAEQDLQSALAKAPTCPELWFNSGLVAMRFAAVLRALGRAAVADQRVEQACAALAKSLAVAPSGWPNESACRRSLAAATAATKR